MLARGLGRRGARERRVPSTCSSPGPSLGTRSGLARLRLIREELPGMSLVLAFSRRPDASLRDIVRTGAVDLLQLPIEDKELAEAVERGIELAGAVPAPRSRPRAAAAAARAPPRAGRPGHRVHDRLRHRRLRQDVLRHQPGLLPRALHPAAGVHRRPRPPVRRGVHRPAAAAEVHDLRRPPARGHRRGRPAGAHRGVLRPARDRGQRAGRAAGAVRGRSHQPARRHPHPRGRPQLASTT